MWTDLYGPDRDLHAGDYFVQVCHSFFVKEFVVVPIRFISPPFGFSLYYQYSDYVIIIFCRSFIDLKHGASDLRYRGSRFMFALLLESVS